MQSGLDMKCKACYAKYAKWTLHFWETECVYMNTRIKELRKARKLSQEELADAVGTTRQTITSIETGKYIASLPLAYRIAKFFGLKIEDVFMLEEDA